MLISGGRLVTPGGVLDDGWLRVDHGRITAVGTGMPAHAVDAHGAWLVPGFIDIHCHGGGGFAFTSPDPAHIRTAAHTHARHGTTTLLASLVSRPVGELVNHVAMLREHVADGLLAGVHLEGPFLSKARCGAHDPAVLMAPDRDSVAALLAAGPVRMVTIAPELDGAVDAVRQVIDSGAVAAIGHTDATEAATMPAIDAGATVATHLFNGMRPLHHREPGPVGALLADDRVSVELICDQVHLSPTIVGLAARLAGPRTVLITDAIAAAGAGDGRYRVGDLRVDVRDGVPMIEGGTSLAGSTLTMDAAFRNFVNAGMGIEAAVHATATRPAEVLGLSKITGSLTPGLSADLVMLDQDLKINAVLRRGEWVIYGW